MVSRFYYPSLPPPLPFPSSWSSSSSFFLLCTKIPRPIRLTLVTHTPNDCTSCCYIRFLTELCLYILPKICWSSIWQGLNRDLACFFLKITCNEGMELPQAGIRQGSVIPSRQRHFMINTVSFKFLCTIKFLNKFKSGKFLNWEIEQSAKNPEITIKMLVLYEGFYLEKKL